MQNINRKKPALEPRRPQRPWRPKETNSPERVCFLEHPIFSRSVSRHAESTVRLNVVGRKDIAFRPLYSSHLFNILIVVLFLDINVFPAVRLFSTIFLLICLTIAAVNDSVIIFGFLLNRPFIASTLCEHRDEPGNSCQGCCLLRKEFESKTGHETAPLPKNHNENNLLLSLAPGCLTTIDTPRSGASLFEPGRSPLPAPLPNEFDHPPKIYFL
jgi:hypothetical protein